MFDREIYVERRRKLKNKLQSGKLLFIGNDEAGMNYADNTYRYRQDSTFLYYFGISKPGLYALIDLDENKEYLFGENPVIDSIIWDGVKTTIEDYSQQIGVENTGSLSQLKSKIDSFDKDSIKYLPPYRGEHFLKLQYLLGYSPNEAKQKIDNKFINAIANQRNVKSVEEIEELEKAVNVTVDMHLAAMRYAQAGMTEAQVTAKVHETALAAGGNISFPIIGTINGQFLHRYHADGMLVATPTGSTGYNLSAGGPIVEPDGQSILITPICAHDLLSRSIVASPERVVTLELTRNARRNGFLSVDGGKAIKLSMGDVTTVRRSNKMTKLVRLNGRSFYDVIHNKFNQV